MAKFWITIGVVSLLLVGCADNGSESETQGTAEAPEAVQEEAAKSESVELTIEGPEGTTQTDVKVSSSPGLNPPHGQPGHDCAIAVGAPLDGSGGQAQPTTSPTVQPAVQPNLNVSAPASGNLNPPHGQPGHDCAVAVGAPLPAK